MRRLLINILLVLLFGIVMLFVLTGLQIATFATHDFAGSHDCAVILGAAAIGERPSPVFQARIDYGIKLYKQGVVQKLIFTGGVGEDDSISEGEVGAVSATKNGVPPSDILFEGTSKTTLQNLKEAKKLMDKNGLHSALIVSDPLHLRRSMMIAEWIGLNAKAAATPYSRYKTWKTRFPFILREIYFTICFHLFRQ